MVGNAAVLDTTVAVRRVLLAPGASAHAAVIASVSPGACQPVIAAGLRVVPPGQSDARYIGHALKACSAAGPGAPVFLRVRAVQPGTGITAGPAPAAGSHPRPPGRRCRPSRPARFPRRASPGTMRIMSVSETGIAQGDAPSQAGADQTDIAEISEISGPGARSTPRPGRRDDASAAGGQHRADLPPDRYLDREQSWVRFNQRVLELAEDDEIPLLERVRFLAIFASNLDEFFMVRVASLMRRMVAGFPVAGAGSQMAVQVLKNTLTQASELTTRHAAVFTELIRPRLAEHKIEILRWKELSPAERNTLTDLFKNRIYPVLTPLVVDPAHPFPFISGLSLNLAVTLAEPGTGATMFARVKVPPLLSRFLKVSQHRYVPIEDVIAAHLGQLFGGMDIIEHYVFRVTRVRELEVDEDATQNLLQAMERELVKRRFEPAVRLEVEEDMSDDVLCRLVKELSVDTNAVFKLPGPLDLTGLNAIADLPIGELRYPAFVPSTRAVPTDTSIFDTLNERDVLVHHPYDSFTTSVERLIEEAAADPRVLAIKQTLYRTSGESPIVDALIDAAEAGKQVVVVVEIKARFDERANIIWARKLEEAGCHVVYGFVGMKTHAKLVLIVRQEADGTLRRYCHIGTGNYHPTTARLYEDFGLLTADETVGEDVTDLFNHLTGYSRKSGYRRLLVAPEALRAGIVGPDRPPGRPGAGGQARQDRVQVQRARRRGGDRRALPGLAGRRAGRSLGARHVRAQARPAGPVRDDPGPQRPRAVPRALADLRLRHRRAGPGRPAGGGPGCRQRGLDRQRRT